jgi:hypothetical protein
MNLMADGGDSGNAPGETPQGAHHSETFVIFAR